MGDQIDRLRNIGVIATVFVVFWHSRATGLALTRGTGEIDVSPIVSQVDAFVHWPGLAVHVPIFFATSGFLYFRSGVPNLAEYRRKTKDRLGSLVLPYVLWNGILLLGLVALHAIPTASNHLVAPGAGPVLSVGDALWRTTGDPIVFQFWYLRELILLSLAAPLIGLAVRSRTAPLWLAWTFLGFCADARIESFLSCQAVFFFSLGALFALRGFPWDIRLPRSTFRGGALLYVAGVLATAFLPIPSLPLALLNGIEVLAGITLLFGGYRAQSAFWRWPIVRKVRTHAFFVYAFHEPLLTILRKAILNLLGTGDSILLLQLFLLPLLALTLSVATGEVLSQSAPFLYRVLTGGRKVTSQPLAVSQSRG